MDRSPWKTPFGRLLIGSSIVAAVIGFALAAGMTTYLRSAAAGAGDVIAADNHELDANATDYPPDSAENGYAAEPPSELPTAEAPIEDQYYSGSPASSQEGASVTPPSRDVQSNESTSADNSADQGGTNQ